MDGHKPLGDFSFRLEPLPAGSAAVLYVVILAAATALWANLSVDAFCGIADSWGILVLVGLPAGLIVFRLLFNLLADVRFAVAVMAALTVISGVAASVFRVEVALERVFRTFSFAALGASLAASLAACILKRRWSRANLAYLALHLGLFIALVGAFLSLFLRVNGFLSLSRGESASEFVLRDHCLTVTAPGANAVRISLPSPLSGRPSYRTHLGSVTIRAVYSGSGTSAAAAALVLFFEDDESADSQAIYYGGAPVRLELAGGAYDVSFGPSHRKLPFSIRLDDAATEYYPGSRLPKEYTAAVTVLPAGDRPAGPSVPETIRVNAPLSRGGLSIYLGELRGSDEAVFEIVRDPGARVVFLGGVVFLAGFLFACKRRLCTNVMKGRT